MVHSPPTVTPAAPTNAYPLSLHDALPIFSILAFLSAMAWLVVIGVIALVVVRAVRARAGAKSLASGGLWIGLAILAAVLISTLRSEEHTSELQSRENLVCRLLLEKKKKTT